MNMEKLKFGKADYPQGSILFDVRYYYKPECFEVVYFNPITNQLEVEYEEAIIDIWFLKEEFRTNKYQIAHAPMDQCYPVLCKPSQVPKMIAEHIGGEWKEYYDKFNGQISNKDLKDHMCKCPWVFKADFTPDVYYRLRWMEKYGEECDVSNVTFGFVDIETDVLDRTIDPKDIYSAPQPINAVSIILPHVKICALLVLSPRPQNMIHEKFWPLLERQQKAFDWMMNNMDEFKRKIVDTDPDNKKYLEGYDIRVHVFDFHREIDLIKTVFDYINKYRPMFVESWNAKFDDNYLIHRAEYLGYDPKDFVIPEAFQTDMLYYKEDGSGKNGNNDKKRAFSIKNSKDWMFSSTYSIYICQMRLFAAIRKSQQERRSYSLSSVGKDIAKIDKLTNTKSGTFREFAYTDFINFLLYNVRDVVVQLAIEMNCHDCQALVSRSYMFATQYSKCFQETHIVRNIREFFFEQEGYVQACRLIVEPGIDTSFKGAFVAPTEKNAPTGYVLNGKPVNNIMYGVLDADAAAYYPSSKMGLNLDPMSLLYKAKINNDIFVNQCVNRSFNQEYYWYDSKNKPHQEDMTGPIMNSYKNGNEMSLLYNWFNLPSVSEYFQYIDSLI